MLLFWDYYKAKEEPEQADTNEVVKKTRARRKPIAEPKKEDVDAEVEMQEEEDAEVEEEEEEEKEEV